MKLSNEMLQDFSEYQLSDGLGQDDFFCYMETGKSESIMVDERALTINEETEEAEILPRVAPGSQF